MHERILIIYATREGHTRRVAEYLRATIEERQHHVDLVNVRDAAHLDWSYYGAAFVACSVHMARHEPAMVEFVLQNRRHLEGLDAAFLSVCMTEARVEDPLRSDAERKLAAKHVDEQLATFFHQTGWHPHHRQAVAGAVLYSRYNLVKRMMMRRIAEKEGLPTDTSRDHVFTNWHALDTFSEKVLGVPDLLLPLGAQPTEKSL